MVWRLSETKGRLRETERLGETERQTEKDRERQREKDTVRYDTVHTGDF